MGLENNSSSSSDEEDGDELWRAAINSVASSYPGLPEPNSKPDPTSNPDSNDADDDDAKPIQPQPLKHYQLKAQKALDDILEKSLFMVKEPDSPEKNDDHSVEYGGGVRLFKRAPVGIVFDHRDELKGPEKKPRLLPGEEVDEKSKKFKRKLKSVVVEGTDILAAAKDACQKAKDRLEAKEAAAKEAARREEERVAQLKKIRGERWLPSIAKEMQAKLKAANARSMK